MKRILWFVIGVSSICLVLLLAREPILRAIGSFLVVQDDLKKADVIVVLGGERDRVDEAARLYGQGYADYIIMTCGSLDEKVSMAAVMRNQATRLGVPRSNIILEPEARSTFEHPILVKPIMQARGFRSAIVVSSPYHMRRAAMLFDRTFKNNGIDLIYHPIQESWFQVDSWWTSPASRRVVGLEYMKLAGNVWGNRVSKFVSNLIK